jgi:hypothetical protein
VFTHLLGGTTYVVHMVGQELEVCSVTVTITSPIAGKEAPASMSVWTEFRPTGRTEER